MIASFAVYLFNRRTAGISRDFAGKNSSLTQLTAELTPCPRSAERLARHEEASG